MGYNKIVVEEIRLNYNDYCQLPDNGKRYEIIDGKLYNARAPFISHQEISARLFILLQEYIIKNRLGMVLYAPVDVLFSNEDIVQPDIIFISKGRKNIIKKKNIMGSPDLIVEILSVTKEQYDRRIKKTLYEKYKVKEYWIVDVLKKKIEVFELINRKYKLIGVFKKKDVIKSKLFPDLKIYLREVF